MNEELPPADAPPEYQVRRATLDDLSDLKALWQSARQPADDLEKRFTEFQVVLNREQQLRAAIGLQIQKQHGLLHTEVFADLNEAAAIRPVLWERLLSVARNNGLVRLWSMPLAHFYREQGMVDISDALRGTFPPAFGNPTAEWLALKLKDEVTAAMLAEKEFEVFTMAQHNEAERVMQQARVFKIAAYLLLLVVLGALAALAIFTFKRAPRSRR